MNLQDNNSAYRRGVLLGLTMAEIMVLIIFLLLLAFATLLNREKQQNLALESLVNQDKDYIKRIVTVISTQEPDMSEDMVRAVENLPAVFSLIRENEISKDGETPSETVIRALEKLKIEKEAKSSISDAPLEQQLIEAIAKQKELESESNNLADQKENLITQMQNEGKGFDWPPCWSTANKKPEYIFKVNLRNEGIIVEDNVPAHRAEDKARLPIQNMRFNTLRSTSQFHAETKDLFEWSKANECRFYVLVNDQTGENEKERFKELLRSVEDRFYKHLNRTSISVQKNENAPESTNDSEEGSSFLGRIFKNKQNLPKEEGYN